MTAVKVINFQNKGVIKFQEVYKAWIESFGLKNELTQKRYADAVRIFCHDVFGKGVQFVSTDDCIGLHKSKVREYVGQLVKEGKKRNTIDFRITVMRCLWVELFDNDINVNDRIFTSVKKNIADDSKPHNNLTKEELQALIQYIELNEKDKKKQKLLAVKLMTMTGMRKTAAINLKWSDFELIIDEHGNEAYKISHIGKGNKQNINWISVRFYRELKDLATCDNKVINIHDKTLTRFLDRYSRVIGKKICPHSLRHTSGTLVYTATKDVVKVKEHLNHSSLRTTERYIHKTVNIAEQASYGLEEIIFI